MGRIDIVIGILLAALALGGAGMMQIGESLFPDHHEIIFWASAALVFFAIVGLGFVFWRARGKQKAPIADSKKPAFFLENCTDVSIEDNIIKGWQQAIVDIGGKGNKHRRNKIIQPKE